MPVGTAAGSIVNQLLAAFDARSKGDPEPLVALFAENAEWRGISRGHLWWKRTPSCSGPDEAREVLKRKIAKCELPLVKGNYTVVAGNKFIGSFAWIGEDGRHHERYHVLTIHDGKIVDMQSCRSRDEAERFARRSGPQFGLKSERSPIHIAVE